MRIPFFRQPATDPTYHRELMGAMEKTVSHGQYILGPEVGEFEQQFASFCGAADCVGVASGCDALYLALKALGVGAGAEVIVPANTFIGTVLPVLQAGAQPVFVDCAAADSNIDVSLIEKAITPRTRAIVPVHLYGRPARMGEILALAEKHGLHVIEDAAQAHGARLGGRRCGSLAPHATFSFYPSKNLGACGDAGAVVTDDPEVARMVRSLRNYGQSAKYHHDYRGWNSRLDTLQAGVLMQKLRHLDEENAARRGVAAEYREQLQGLPLAMPEDKPEMEPVYHLFVILTERRDELAAYLNKQGIETGIHYPIPCHRQKCVEGLVPAAVSFPEAERQARQVLSLPMFAGLEREEVGYVAGRVREFFSQQAA